MFWPIERPAARLQIRYSPMNRCAATSSYSVQHHLPSRRKPYFESPKASQDEVLVSPLGRACRGVEAWWLRDCCYCCSPVSPRPCVTRARELTTVLLLLLLLSLHYLASTAPLDALASSRVSTCIVAPCATRSLLRCSRPDRAAVVQLPRHPSLELSADSRLRLPVEQRLRLEASKHLSLLRLARGLCLFFSSAAACDQSRNLIQPTHPTPIPTPTPSPVHSLPQLATRLAHPGTRSYSACRLSAALH